jgi:hypothetical protein
MTILQMVMDWWRLRRAATELHELDERMLRDIGIAREEIGHVVRFGRAPDGVRRLPAEAGLVHLPVSVSAPGYKRATKRRTIDARQIRAA